MSHSKVTIELISCSGISCVFHFYKHIDDGRKSDLFSSGCLLVDGSSTELTVGYWQLSYTEVVKWH